MHQHTGKDEIWHYQFSEDSDNSTNSNGLEMKSCLKLGAGDSPRHIAFYPNDDHDNIGINTIYVNGQLNNCIHVIEYEKESNKLIQSIQRLSSLPKKECDVDNMTSQIMVEKSGNYLYCGNRGHDSIVCFKIDKENNKGLLIEDSAQWFNCNGNEPRHFNIDPTNNFLVVANQEGNKPNISIFKIDHENNGALNLVNCIDDAKCPAYIQFVQKM